MCKSGELLRMERDMSEHPELREKLDAEIKRIAGAGEAQSDGEAMMKAAAALGYTVTVEELERAAADLEKLDDDELDATGGAQTDNCGIDVRSVRRHRKECGKFSRADKAVDEHGHDGSCLFAWHCLAAILHTETKTHDVYCWSDHACSYVKQK